jgi:hypothetical protein
VLLVVSDTTGREGVPHNMYLLQRWFPVMLAVTGGSRALGDRVDRGVKPEVMSAKRQLRDESRL